MYFSQRYAFKQLAIKVIQSKTESQFTYLKLTALEFQLAMFEEQELFINGQLFDIIDKKNESGNVIVKVYRDTQEESFLKKTIDWFDASTSSQTTLPKIILKTFFSPVVLTEKMNSCFPNFVIVEMNSDFLIQLLNVFFVPITPPPAV